MVSTPDLGSAYRIFSVLSSRGLDISATDILKANIIGALPSEKRECYTEKWEDAEEEVGRDAFAELFAHIRMIYHKKKPESTLIKEFKEHVTEVGTPARFIDHVLLPITEAYTSIAKEAYEGASGAEAVNAHFGWLNRLEFTDWMPPALAYFALHKQNCKAVAAFFKDLERLAHAMLVRPIGARRSSRAIL